MDRALVNALIELIFNAAERDAKMTDEERQALVQQRLAEQRRRTAQRNARFARMLANATDMQQARISKLENEQNMTAVKLWQKRDTGRIAVMMQKEGVWDQKTGRIRTKLVMVYPDGRFQESFQKVPLHNDWF